MRTSILYAVAVICAVAPSTSWGKSVTIGASRDNSLFQNNTSNSAGGLFAMFTGNNMMNSPRHALIKFDVAQSLPAGVEITGVKLTLYLANTPGGGTQTVDMHRLTSDWTEGAAGDAATTFSMIGNGFPSDAANGNGATWSHSTFSSTSWANPGGDYAPTVSASASVGSTIDTPVDWLSTQQLIDDVQGWLDSPASNYGWLLRNPGGSNTIRAFYTRSAGVGNDFDAAWQPALTITYVPEPATASLLISLALFAPRVRRQPRCGNQLARHSREIF